MLSISHMSMTSVVDVAVAWLRFNLLSEEASMWIGRSIHGTGNQEDLEPESGFHDTEQISADQPTTIHSY